MYCKHCGIILESEANFCPTCGQNLLDGIPNPPLLQTEHKKYSPLWFKTLVCLVILGISGFTLTALLSEDLTDTVKEQLQMLQNGQITEAYYDFTSKKFQEATPLERFHEFVKKHPAFARNKSINFTERNVNNDIGVLSAVITTTDDKKIPVEYKLIKEGDKWKVLSIRLQETGDSPTITEVNQSVKRQLPSKIQQSNHPDFLQFTKFVTGNSINTKGIIKTPSRLFTSDSGDIYLNLYIKQAVTGAQIEIVFKHLDSLSSLTPVSTRITNPEDSVLSFVFSPPKSGWPKGNYQIQAKASTGTKNSFDFKIE